MFKFEYGVFIVVVAVTTCYCINLEPQCEYSRGLHVPKLIYTQLDCIQKYGKDNCIVEFKCPHMDRPKDTCYFNGKIIKIDEKISNEAKMVGKTAGCSCTKSLDFSCPQLSDGCPESWVNGYPKPGCYLGWELNSQCASREICPPFEQNVKCKAGEKAYKEGELFEHPADSCTQCVCEKGLTDKFEAPFCQPVNCTNSLLQNHKKVMNFCAPLYTTSRCCPNEWICPQEADVYHPNPIPSPKDDPNLKCHFGDKIVPLGDYFERMDADIGEITCECIIPPFLYCTVYKRDLKTYD